MSDETVAVIRAIYDALAAGDVAGVLGRMAPGIEWNEAESFIYADGNPYRGPEAVLNGVFARCIGEWEGFAAVPHEILDAGDTVLALGRYGGVNKKTGAQLDAQFAHVWRVADGKAAGFQQYADTLKAARASGAI